MSYVTKNKISAQDLTVEHRYPECGGLCCFEGLVRNHHEGKSVTKLFYEAYEPMAELEIEKLKNKIETEWPECHVAVKHRVGEMNIGDVAVAISVWAPHRHEAFVACESLINRIKKRVPIWKHEFYADGTHAWVACHHHEK